MFAAYLVYILNNMLLVQVLINTATDINRIISSFWLKSYINLLIAVFVLIAMQTGELIGYTI